MGELDYAAAWRTAQQEAARSVTPPGGHIGSLRSCPTSRQPAGPETRSGAAGRTAEETF